MRCTAVLQGFLVNRVLIPMINEAFFCLMEVRARPYD
jgi:3-hydroxyacyl-CoA dehydrogenase